MKMAEFWKPEEEIKQEEEIKEILRVLEEETPSDKKRIDMLEEIVLIMMSEGI